MPALAILRELPPHFLVDERESGALALRREHAEALRALGFSLESDGRTQAGGVAGRVPLRVLRDGERTWVIRRFTHGGLLRWLTGERFLDAQRPFREVLLAERLGAHGIATPEIAAARARRLPGGGWGLTVVTRRVAGAIDLGVVLERCARGDVEQPARAAILLAAGALVAQLHALGFLHADLHPKNLLVDEAALRGAPARMWVLDLDRSVFRGRLTDAERRANLRRLFRYVWRRAGAHGFSVTRTDCRRFLCGYAPEGACWKEDWRAVQRMHARTLALHRLGWIFERGAR